MRRKIVYQFLVGNGVVVCNMVLTIVLSRLLSPDEIGVFSIAAVLVSVAHVFRDFGVGSYLKQAKELTPQLIRSAFGLLLVTSWIVAAAIYFSASLWGEFFNDPRVAEVVRILALGFIFIPFGTVPEAILTREYAVKQLAKAAAFTISVYFSVSVILALSGFSYKTMAWANFVNIIVSGLAYRFFLVRPIPWMPSFNGWGLIAHFGFGNILTSLLKVADNSLPDLILGKFSDASSVGLYSRAKSTVNMISIGVSPTINFFALPYLSRIHHGNAGMADEFLRIGSIINSILLPPLVWIAIMAPELVQFLYGSQWMASVPVIPWLCGAIGLSTLFTLTIPALQGSGKPYAFALPLLLTLAAKGIFISFLFDGSVTSFAKSMLFGQLVMIPVYVYANRIFLKVSVRRWLDDVLWLSSILFICSICLWLFSREGIPGLGLVLRLGLTILMFGSVYLGLVLLSTLPIKGEIMRFYVELKTRLISMRS